MRIMTGEPRAVAAGRGAAWWGEGLRMFGARFGAWILLAVVYLVVSVLIGLVPYVGGLGHSLLTPVLVGGIMIGCRAIGRGEPLRVSHLFEGFQGTHFLPLLVIGAINLALAAAMTGLLYLGIVGSVGLADVGRVFMSPDPFGALVGSTATISGAAIAGGFAVLVLATVLAMLNWFAPALVTLRGATAVEAMKLSFVACLRNWVPFLVYALVFIAFAVAATAALGGALFALGAGAFGALMGGFGGSGVGAMLGVFALMLLVVAAFALVAGPIVMGSIYAGYEDTLDTDGALDNPAYR
jgi:uncharacterized membrane protein